MSEGLTDFLNVLDAERQRFLKSKPNTKSPGGWQAVQLVALYKAAWWRMGTLPGNSADSSPRGLAIARPRVREFQRTASDFDRSGFVAGSNPDALIEAF